MPKTDIIVEIDINGPEGNAFFILGKVSKCLRSAGHGDLVDGYQRDAMSGDYQNLLAVTRDFVTVKEV